MVDISIPFSVERGRVPSRVLDTSGKHWDARTRDSERAPASENFNSLLYVCIHTDTHDQPRRV